MICTNCLDTGFWVVRANADMTGVAPRSAWLVWRCDSPGCHAGPAARGRPTPTLEEAEALREAAHAAWDVKKAEGLRIAADALREAGAGGLAKGDVVALIVGATGCGAYVASCALAMWIMWGRGGPHVSDRWGRVYLGRAPDAPPPGYEPPPAVPPCASDWRNGIASGGGRTRRVY